MSDAITYFLIEHDVATCTAEVRGEFADADAAHDAFFALERQHLQDDSKQIILLGAESLDDLKITHGNLFERPQPFSEELLGPKATAALRGEPVPGD